MAIKHIKVFFLVSVSAVITFLAGCGSLSIKSLWKDKEITIDARSDEWTSGTYIKEADCSFYARNDAENLYLCLISSNRDLGQRIMMNGLSIWIESDKEKNNRFGIHYPVGIKAGMRESGGGRREQNMIPEDEMPLPVIAEEYELISKDGLLEGRYGFSEDSGIKMKTGIYQGRFIYEVKLPLKAKNAAMGEIAADASSLIKLNFTLDNILSKREKGTDRDRDYDVRGRVGMPEGEAMEGGQGYGRGNSGRMNNGQEMQAGKRFELKADLTLSSEGGK